MEIFFSVGEPSGDQHAAHLIHELRRRRPDLRVTGYGGPLMQSAGCQLHHRLTDLAVMGFFKILPLLWTFLSLVRRADLYFRNSRPDAVVLVDFPGFNWWIARKAKAAGVPVFYYLPPQLWAWAPWRVARIRKYVDRVLCALPFEKKWYAERGIDVEYVGHPFFDEVADYRLDERFIDRWCRRGVRNVGLLPGSRNHEVSTIWPLMVGVMQRLHRRHPNLRFLVACYRQEHREACRQMLRDRGVNLPVYMFVDRTSEVIELSECCLMTSGSVSLEMLARGRPAVVLYRVGRLMYPILRALVHIDFITLPNLIAGRPVLPEWVVAWFPGRDVDEVAARLDDWLSDSDALAASAIDVSRIRRQVVQTGATARAAEAIFCHLSRSRRRLAA